jgi:hypothetical protein
LAKLAPQASKAPREMLAYKGHLARRVKKVGPALKVSKACKVKRARQVRRGCRDLRVIRVLTVLQASKAPREILAYKEYLALRVIQAKQAKKVLLVPLALGVNEDCKDYRVRLALKAQLARKVRPKQC